jgi:PemK-like, MazF-like toxin of type II toxin-antitoxin system
MAGGRFGRLAGQVAGRLASSLVQRAAQVTRRPARRPPGGSAPVTAAVPQAGDEIGYAPRDDDRPDPGEVVWAWVPFDEGDGRGKDRPVVVIGRRGTDLLALMLTSKDHDRDAADEARYGRVWTDIGSGPWDARNRPSEVRLDRLLVLDPARVRREGAALDRPRFENVVAEARRVQGW